MGPPTRSLKGLLLRITDQTTSSEKANSLIGALRVGGIGFDTANLPTRPPSPFASRRPPEADIEILITSRLQL
jgi:hypothetical protein